jgi:hypothetical protein
LSGSDLPYLLLQGELPMPDRGKLLKIYAEHTGKSADAACPQIRFLPKDYIHTVRNKTRLGHKNRGLVEVQQKVPMYFDQDSFETIIVSDEGCIAYRK